MVIPCCWPGCNNPSLAPLPICIGHVSEVVQHQHATNVWVQTLTEVNLKRQLAEKQKAEKIAARRERGTQQGWIYYIRVGEHVKIGYSADVPQRLRNYPPDSKLLAVHPGTPDLERQIHRDLATSRAWGREWYRPDLAVTDRIDQAVAQFGTPAPFAIKVRNTQQPMKPKSWR